MLVYKVWYDQFEMIFFFSSQVSKGKTSAEELSQALHKKLNLTLSSLDEKISTLEKEFAEKRQRAFQALHVLHGGELDTEKEKPVQQPTTQPTHKTEAEPR